MKEEDLIALFDLAAGDIIMGPGISRQQFIGLMYEIGVLDKPLESTFAVEWLALWPDKRELETHGIKRDPPDVLKVQAKLATFIKEFKKRTGILASLNQKKLLILETTLRYIQRFRRGEDDWKWISDPSNFISHSTKGSKLAAYIMEKEKPKTDSVNNSPDYKFA